MEHSHHLEREVKLEADAEWSVPDLAGVFPGAEPRPMPTLLLETTYFDTADRRLEGRRIALRYRWARPDGDAGEDTEGSSGEWTVKLPPSAGGAALSRTEVNWPAPGNPAPGDAGPGGPTGNSPGPVPSPPSEVAALLMGVTLGQGLQPIARLSSTRRRTEVVAWTRKAAEVDDDTVEGTVLGPLAVPGEAPTVRFREVEVELADGSPDRLLDAIVARLVSQGARPSGRRSKLASVLQSAAQPTPAAEEVAALQAEKAARKKKAPTLADLLQEQAATCLDILLEHDPPIRLGDPDPEHVHKARVATRRFRSVLWALRRLRGPSTKPGTQGGQPGTEAAAQGEEAAGGLGDGAPHSGDGVALVAHTWLTSLRRELHWLGDALGAARDADVRLMVLEEETAKLGPLDQRGAEKVLAVARSDRGGAHQKLHDVMASDRYLMTLRSLEALARRSGLAPAELWQYLDLPAVRAMGQLGRAQWRSVRRAARRLGSSPSDEGLHRLRIQTKRLRYLTEAATPVVRPAPSRRAAAAMATSAAQLQDVLGELHDAVINEQWLRDLAARPASWLSGGPDEHGNGVAIGSTDVAIAAGQLVAAARARASSCRATWKQSWDRLARKELARWLPQ